MSAKVFVDTNLLVYAHTRGDDARHARAAALVTALWDRPGEIAVSIQVLQELYVNLLRKGAIAPDAAARIVENYFHWRVIENDRVLLTAAMRLQSRWQLSLWDALVVAAAQRSGAPELWSEDFSAGQDFDGCVVVHPLR